VAWRKGRKVSKVQRRQKVGTEEAVAWIRRIIDNDDPAAVFIDSGGGGAQIYDMVCTLGERYEAVMVLVNFGGSPEEEYILMENGEERAGPKNRRAEMWMRSRDWLQQPGGADIPDEGGLQSDATAPGYKYDTVTQHLILESKEQMRARKARSPDDWDAIALTFASVVYDDAKHHPEGVAHKKKKASSSRSGRFGWLSR
jgi:hypothetical protein